MGPYAAFEAAFSEHVILDGVPVRAGLPLTSPPEDHCGPLTNALTPPEQKVGERGSGT